MIRLAVALSSLVLLSTACKKDPAPPADLPPAIQKEVDKAVKEHVPEVPTGAAAAAPAATQKLNCEALISTAVRTKYFPGTTMTQEPQCPGCPEACKFTKEKDPAPPSIMFDCRDRERPNWFEQMSKLLGSTGKQVDGVGRLARGQMSMQLMWVPEKFDCVATITWMGGGDQLLPLAKELEAALTKEGLGI